jgi:hypothetical protein
LRTTRCGQLVSYKQLETIIWLNRPWRHTVPKTWRTTHQNRPSEPHESKHSSTAWSSCHKAASQKDRLNGCQHCELHVLLLLLLHIRSQPHLGCCLAAATAAAPANFMHLCTNSAIPCTSRQHMKSCNDVNGNCAHRRSRLTTAVAGHDKSRWAASFTGRSRKMKT